jgi:hypothetical protein
MAMGIPTIVANDLCSPRMGWLEKFLPIYTPSTFAHIDWNPKPVDIESIKAKMCQVFEKKVMSTYDKYYQYYDLSWAVGDSVNSKNDYLEFYLSYLKKNFLTLDIARQKNFKYIIFGAGSTGRNLLKAIRKMFPNSEYLFAVDSSISGEFDGAPINKPETILQHPGVFIFVTSYTGRIEIPKWLESHGKQSSKDFIVCSVVSG